MATPDEIEVMRCRAFDEQFVATLNEQEPDRQRLNEIANSIALKNRPLVCYAPVAYRVEHLGNSAHITDTVIGEPRVIGKFGGFFSGMYSMSDSIETTKGGDEDTLVPQVGFYIKDMDNTGNGYVCPVETTDIVDVIDRLTGDDIFMDLGRILTSEIVDMSDFLSAVDRMRAGNEYIPFYDAYIKGTIQPSDLYTRIFAGKHYLMGFRQPSVDRMSEKLELDIDDSYTFNLFSYDLNDPQLAIAKCHEPQVIVPVKELCGVFVTPRHDLTTTIYDADLRNPPC